MSESVKIYEVGGINVSLSETEGLALSRFLSQMSAVPRLDSMIGTDENGLIVSFEPKDISWGFVFFVQNIMIMQRLRMMDDFLRKENIIK